jgi:hypothetical protein
MVIQCTRSALLCKHFVFCSNFTHAHNVGGKIHVDVVKEHQRYKIYLCPKLCSLKCVIKISIIFVKV